MKLASLERCFSPTKLGHFVGSALNWDPVKRPSADMLLKHEFLQGSLNRTLLKDVLGFRDPVEEEDPSTAFLPHVNQYPITTGEFTLYLFIVLGSIN